MEKRVTFNERWLPYALVAPQIIITILFFFWPSGQMIWQSVLLEDSFGGNSRFVWFENFEHLFTDSRGFGWLSEDDFVKHFAGDVDPKRAHVLYAVQQPLASSAFTDVMGEPAWKSLPSWYLVAQNDEAIPPDAERQFATRMGATTVEVPASHVAMVSHPEEVVQLIEKAAETVGAVAS